MIVPITHCVQRWAAGVEYNGQHYYGWQSQNDINTPGVQTYVEEALSKVANHAVTVFCAGRTDSGVHGTGQVVHFDTSANRTPIQWMRGANTNLPRDIRLRWVTPVDESFHARFSATSRRYTYCIDNRSVAPGVFYGLHSAYRRPLDAALMHAEAQSLIGEHDFSSFRAAGCQSKSPVRHITHLSVRREQHMIMLDIEANAFLQHMVRNIAGVLMAVGSGQQEQGWVASVLAAKNRCDGGVTAPPHGLYLVGVSYPSQYGLPSGDHDRQSILTTASE